MKLFEMIIFFWFVTLICSSNCANNPKHCRTLNGENGQCVPNEKCSHLESWKDSLMSNKLNSNHYFNDPQCGNEVCCVSGSIPDVYGDHNLKNIFNFISKLYKDITSSELDKSKPKTTYGFFSYQESNDIEETSRPQETQVTIIPKKDNSNDIQKDEICTVTFESNDIKNRIGVCILPYECKYFTTIWKRLTLESMPIINKLMEDSRCGFDTITNSALICCPDDDMSQRTLPSNALEPQSNVIVNDNYDYDVSIETDMESSKVSQPLIQDQQLSNFRRHANFHLLPETCGDSDSGRIFNGEKASLLQYPWMALLILKKDKETRFACGGSIISQRYILTAAHCVADPHFILSAVRVGEHTISTTKDCEGSYDNPICVTADDFDVENIIIHQDYQFTPDGNDIALIRLKKPMTYKMNVLPICLPLSEELKNKNLMDKEMIVAGWGFTERGSNSDTLMWTKLTVVSNSKCAKTFRTITVSDKQICAGGKKNEDSCKGDSGGPLMQAFEVMDVTRMVQYGIVSYGIVECGVFDTPAVYTDVTKYIDWILDNLKE